MNTSTAIVIVAITLAMLLAFALYRRPHVKAGGRYKEGEFFIEVSDRDPDARR